MVYSWPGVTSGLEVTSDGISRLAKHPNIVGTKQVIIRRLNPMKQGLYGFDITDRPQCWQDGPQRVSEPGVSRLGRSIGLPCVRSSKCAVHAQVIHTFIAAARSLSALTE